MQISLKSLKQIINEEIQLFLIEEGWLDTFTSKAASWLSGGDAHSDDVKTPEQEANLKLLNDNPEKADKIVKHIVDWLIKRVIYDHKEHKRDFRDLMASPEGKQKAKKRALEMINKEFQITGLVSTTVDQIVDVTRISDHAQFKESGEGIEVLASVINASQDEVQAIYKYISDKKISPFA